MKQYFIREVEPAENGAHQYGVFRYEAPKNYPHIQLTRPKHIATFSHEWRAIRFMKDKYKENEDKND